MILMDKKRAQASLKSHSRAAAGRLHAQASLEFMASTFLVLLLFGIAVWMYGTSMAEAGALKSSMEANRVCAQVSATLSSLASSGGVTTYRFSLPPKVNGENYTISVVSARNLIKVDFANRGGVGCASREVRQSDARRTAGFGRLSAACTESGMVLPREGEISILGFPKT